MKMRSKKASEWTTYNGINNVTRHNSICHTFKNLLILVQNLIAYTKFIFPFPESIPSRTIRAML